MKLLLLFEESKRVRELNSISDLHPVIQETFLIEPNSYLLQKFDEEFGEFVDLEDENTIEDKSKIKVLRKQVPEQYNNSLTFTDDEEPANLSPNFCDVVQDVVVLPISQRQWPDYIEISTEYFSKSLLQDLEEKKFLSWDKSRELVGHLANLAYSFKLYPNKAERLEICQALVSKYPYLRNSIGSGLGGWEIKLLNKLKKLRQGDSSLAVRLNRTNSKVPGSKVPRNIHINPKKGELNWAPEHLLGETTESLLFHKKIMREESLKSLKEQDAGKMSALMSLTYSFRRERINSKVLLCDLKEEYPLLFQKDQQFEEFHRLTSVSIHEAFVQESSNQGVFLFEIFRKKKKVKSKESEMLHYFNEFTKDYDMSKQLQAKIDFGFFAIPYLLNEDIDCMFKMIDYNEDTQDFDTSYPKIFLPGDFLNSTFIIAAENLELYRSASFIEAVSLLISFYYTLNIEYAPAVSNSLKFLQQNVLKIKSGGMRPKVQTLINKVFSLQQKYH